MMDVLPCSLLEVKMWSTLEDQLWRNLVRHRDSDNSLSSWFVLQSNRIDAVSMSSRGVPLLAFEQMTQVTTTRTNYLTTETYVSTTFEDAKVCLLFDCL